MHVTNCMYNIFLLMYKRNVKGYRKYCGDIWLIELQVISLCPLCSFIAYFQSFYSKHAIFIIRKKQQEIFQEKIFIKKNKNDWPQPWRSLGQFAPRVSWFQTQYYFNCLLVWKSCSGRPTFRLPAALSGARWLAPWRSGSQPGCPLELPVGLWKYTAQA